jgi:hypothetical protein
MSLQSLYQLPKQSMTNAFPAQSHSVIKEHTHGPQWKQKSTSKSCRNRGLEPQCLGSLTLMNTFPAQEQDCCVRARFMMAAWKALTGFLLIHISSQSKQSLLSSTQDILWWTPDLLAKHQMTLSRQLVTSRGGFCSLKPVFEYIP